MSTNNNISEAQLAANRLNAQHSTGPTSEAGKARVGLNAVKTGLTGRTILLTAEEASAYETLMNDLQQAHQPEGILERSLVQSLVDLTWRLDHIPGLEYAYLTLGYGEICAAHPEIFQATPLGVIEAKVRLMYEKQFHNLELQEKRLASRRDKETQQLAALQAARKAKELEELNEAAKVALVAEQNKEPFNLAANGFVFSTQKFEAHMAKLTPAMKTELLKQAVNQVKQTQKAA
jgi:hypothetical protein